MRKVIRRKCLVTNEMYDKRELVRVVRTPDQNVIVDTTGRANGRGAYIKLSKENIELAKSKDVFKKALNVEIDDDIYKQLESLINE